MIMLQWLDQSFMHVLESDVFRLIVQLAVVGGGGLLAAFGMYQVVKDWNDFEEERKNG